jgi:hypothetical protein
MSPRISEPEHDPPALPTRRRARLPRQLSYPLGAKQISKVVDGIPQFDVLELSFARWYYTELFRKENKPVPVLSASYIRSDASPLQSKFDAERQDPGWRLTVRPVPNAEAAACRTLLLETGLPRARAWLVSSRSETWLRSSHEIEVSFAGDHLEFRED